MSVSQEQQPVIRFRVPDQSFHDELKQAALDRGETPSIFIRRAIADRLYPPQDPPLEVEDTTGPLFEVMDTSGESKMREGFIIDVVNAVGWAEKIDSRTLAASLGISPKLLADRLRPFGVTPRQLRFPEGKMQGYHGFDIRMASVKP